MKFVYASKDMAVSDSLKSRVEKKLSKLERYFREEPEATIRFKVQKGARNIVEITVNAAGVILRAEESSNDMYLSIDHAVDVIKKCGIPVSSSRREIPEGTLIEILLPKRENPPAKRTETAVV